MIASPSGRRGRGAGNLRKPRHVVHRRFPFRSARGVRAEAADGLARPVRCAAVGRDDLEAQRARERRGLDEPHLDRVAEPIRLAGARADQRARRFLEAEIFVAERRGRHEAVRAGLGRA